MSVTDALPDRPLKFPEVEAIETADGVEAAEPTVYRREYPPVVSVALTTGEELVTLGFDPDAGEWAVADRRPREGCY